jgi:hypothetical protein
MLPAMAFSSFRSRHQEPSVTEGFQDVLNVDFKVWIPLTTLGSNFPSNPKQALTAITTFSSKGRQSSDRPGLGTGSREPNKSSENFGPIVCGPIVTFASGFLCISQRGGTTWCFAMTAFLSSADLSECIIWGHFCCSFPRCILECFAASFSHWLFTPCIFNGRVG